MEPNVASSAMSLSLLARNVYCVCFADRDSLDILRGELALARERYFTGGCKTLRVGKREVIRGFEGKLQGKLSRRGFFWRKSAHNVTGTGNLLLEEAFDQKGGYLLVNRDFRNIIASRVFFNKALAWLKSEYYEPWDTQNARVIFKPVDADDLVERFDWDAAKKRYRSTMLYPVPYLEGDAGQSLLNAQFGEPKLLVSTGEGMFCYCPKEEAQRRKEALADLRRGTLVILPAWEVKEGSLAAPGEPEGPDITFSSLEEYAHIQEPPVKDLPAMEAPEEETIVKAPVPGEEAAPAVPEEPAPQEEVEVTAPEKAIVEAPVPGEKAAPAVSEEPAPQEEVETPASEAAAGERPLPEEAAPSGEAPAAQEERAQEPAPQAGPAEEPSPWEPQDAEDREILQAAREVAGVQTQGLSPANGPSYRGELREGLPWGQGRTEQPNGRTSYEGEFRAGKREGFGAYYYKNGSLCYAGSWKEDKKDGLGVSFRESDHILHIAKWKEGAPGEFVSLFDKEGNLRYGGRIEDGKKQGAGVSYNAADGTVFVGKWQDGQPTGIGSAFDREGNLAYYGAWKDGKRHGHGTEFDSAGAIVFDGEWRDGKYYNGILYQKKGPEDAAPSGEPSPAGELPNWDL